MRTLVELDDLVRVYRALGDGTRLHLVKLLAELEPGHALCVNALVAELGVTQPAVSQHLRVLRAADLVIAERRGYHVHYSLNPATLAAYRRLVFSVLGEQFVAPPTDAAALRAAKRRRRACQAEHAHDEGRSTMARAGRRRPS